MASTVTGHSRTDRHSLPLHYSSPSERFTTTPLDVSTRNNNDGCATHQWLYLRLDDTRLPRCGCNSCPFATHHGSLPAAAPQPTTFWVRQRGAPPWISTRNTYQVEERTMDVIHSERAQEPVRECIRALKNRQSLMVPCASRRLINVPMETLVVLRQYCTVSKTQTTTSSV